MDYRDVEINTRHPTLRSGKLQALLADREQELLDRLRASSNRKPARATVALGFMRFVAVSGASRPGRHHEKADQPKQDPLDDGLVMDRDDWYIAGLLTTPRLLAASSWRSSSRRRL